MIRAPQNLQFTIVACFYPPTTQTTAGAPLSTSTISATQPLSSTSTLAPTTSALPPTTTTMNYCTEEKGMNQPLTIQPDQITSSPPSNPTTPSGDINPTTGTPGLDFPSSNPVITVTFNQPATLTVIYVPTDRPTQPTTVETFTIQFVYPNGTTSEVFPSQTPSATGITTTTASTATAGETTTTLPTPSGVIPPSPSSPQVDLPPNFQIPQNTTIIITVTSTKDDLPATGVCYFFSS
jgi:hypothetical protein